MTPGGWNSDESPDEDSDTIRVATAPYVLD
jgi:hypothetical protein